VFNRHAQLPAVALSQCKPSKHPARIELAPRPWQGRVQPQHLGRKQANRIVKDRGRGQRSEAGGQGTEGHCLGLLISGLRRLTSPPVGPVRVELTTSCLRGRCNCLSASTPFVPYLLESPHRRPGNRTQRDVLIRLVRSTRPSSPVSCCFCHGSGAIRTLINSLKRQVCYPLTPRSRWRFRVCVWIGDAFLRLLNLVSPTSVVALRIERSAAVLSGPLGPPALDYRSEGARP
jgi:hypothetical protein